MLLRVSMGLLVALGLAGGTSVAPTLTITHRARALQPGELVVLTISSETALSSIEVKAFGRVQRVQAIPPTVARPHAWIAFVGIDLDIKPGTQVVAVTFTSDAGGATADGGPELCKSAGKRGCANRQGVSRVGGRNGWDDGAEPRTGIDVCPACSARGEFGVRYAKHLQRQGAQFPQRC
jgi:hypothetical protein